MTTTTPLSYIHRAFAQLENHFKQKEKEREIEPVLIENEAAYIAFLSIGNPKVRARVFNASASSISQVFSKLQKKAETLVKKNFSPEWMKVDVVTKVEKISFEDLQKRIETTRKNYFRYGIAFDPEFRLALLEQELHGNAIIRSVNKGPLAIHDPNMNHYLNYKHGKDRFPFMKIQYRNKPVYVFQTTASFMGADSEVVDLYNGELSNGIRKVDDIQAEVKEMIKKSTYYLANQVLADGKFVYGYFSAFAKEINTYNILRHASSLYAMAEGYEVVQDKKIIQTVELGIDYLIRQAIFYKDEETAFVVDFANENEIKLGSNATAILAMAKYMEVTGDWKYLETAQALARGILQMKTATGGFVHVLTYPGYEVKDAYRIIYYEGEAVFALLRLYALDKEDLWLQEVKKSFDYFIERDYWKHHDHWLSYAANEITMYEPEEKYFIFGLKNCNDRLDFIYNRDTTYPTFLELTMAAYKLVSRIKELGKDHLLEYIDEEWLEKTIDHRAEYQRVGFFYPEVAMYMKNPGLILNGFFIRHHSLRVRIDDVEHYLSGYCQYLRYRTPDLPEKFHASLKGVK